MPETIAETIDISEDITIRESGFDGYYIEDHLSYCEIEVTPQELNEIAKYAPIVKELINAGQLALVELDRIGSDFGFEPERYPERIKALDAMRRAIRKMEGK